MIRAFRSWLGGKFIAAGRAIAGVGDSPLVITVNGNVVDEEFLCEHLIDGIRAALENDPDYDPPR